MKIEPNGKKGTTVHREQQHDHEIYMRNIRSTVTFIQRSTNVDNERFFRSSGEVEIVFDGEVDA